MSRAEEQTARVQAVFDDWARAGRAEGMERGHGPTARRGIEALALGFGDRYLDIGCGNGYTLRWVAPVVGPTGRVVGLDLSEEMVARARQAVSAWPHAAVFPAAFPRHDLERAAFDGIFSMEVLYYLPDIEAALREVRRLLAPGGRFACGLDFYAENEASRTWPEELGCPMTRWSAARWRGAFEEAGFIGIAQERVRPPAAPGTAPGWKQTAGSLLTLGTRPPEAPGEAKAS